MMSGLHQRNCAHDPFEQFVQWHSQAKAAGLLQENAAALATVDESGQPAVRMVLVKSFAEQQFCFFTNYHSRKGMALAGNQKAALLFWWPLLNRQVRIEGEVTKLPSAVSDAYFHSRPQQSQLGAIASNQSQPLTNKVELMQRVEKLQQQWDGCSEIVRPQYWGGYSLTAHYYEFWQEGDYRLHDRICYRLIDGIWERQRLSP